MVVMWRLVVMGFVACRLQNGTDGRCIALCVTTGCHTGWKKYRVEHLTPTQHAATALIMFKNHCGSMLHCSTALRRLMFCHASALYCITEDSDHAADTAIDTQTRALYTTDTHKTPTLQPAAPVPDTAQAA